MHKKNPFPENIWKIDNTILPDIDFVKHNQANNNVEVLHSHFHFNKFKQFGPKMDNILHKYGQMARIITQVY